MKRLPLLSTTMASPKEWLWAMWTVKFFACFIVAIKWPVYPTFAGVNTERQRRLLHLFKAQHLSNHQRWYTFVEKQWLFATLEAEFILWAVWNILKRIHILVDFSVWWSTRMPKTSTTHHVIFMTCGSFVWQVVTLRWKYLNWVSNRSRSTTRHAAWKCGLLQKLETKCCLCSLFKSAFSISDRTAPTVYKQMLFLHYGFPHETIAGVKEF